jgi:hypothetical protein
MHKSKSAFLLSVLQLARLNQSRPGKLYMWTFTLPTVVSTKEAKTLWGHLLTVICQHWPKFRGLRIFELHKNGHGLHVHLLTCHWVHVSYMREFAQRVGWGHPHVKEIPVEAAGPYLAKDFSRKAGCLKGWRLWAGFGPWTWTKVSKVLSDTPFTRIYRACKEAFGWTGNHDFLGRVRKVNCILRRTIVEGWTDGLGPGGRPYSCFSMLELLGYFQGFDISP